MIFDLCQDIQEFLYIHNKPPTVIKSFYEQRLESQQIQEKQHEEQEMFCDAKKQIEDQLVIFFLLMLRWFFFKCSNI